MEKLKDAAHLKKLETTPRFGGCVVYVACAFLIFSRVTLYVLRVTRYKKLRVLIWKLFPCGSPTEIAR
jgi:hypothetical protein